MGTRFSSWYVSIDAGRRAQSPQSGPGWSPALKMEPVLFPPSAAPAQRCLRPSWGRKCQRQARQRLGSRSLRWETQPWDGVRRALCWTGRAPGGLRWAGWGVPRSLLGTGPVAVSSGFRAKSHRGSSDLGPDAGCPAQSWWAGLPPPEASVGADRPAAPPRAILQPAVCLCAQTSLRGCLSARARPTQTASFRLDRLFTVPCCGVGGEAYHTV